jgi:hypothetical protein
MANNARETLLIVLKKFPSIILVFYNHNKVANIKNLHNNCVVTVYHLDRIITFLLQIRVIMDLY